MTKKTTKKSSIQFGIDSFGEGGKVLGLVQRGDDDADARTFHC